MFENLVCPAKGRKNWEDECALYSSPEPPRKCKTNKPTNQPVEDIERNDSRE